MAMKFSEDVIPLGDIKINPGKVVRHVAESHRPVLLTSRGRGVAVVQAVADFELDSEERHFMKAVVEGLLDLEEGREASVAEVKKRLGLTRGASSTAGIRPAHESCASGAARDC